MCQIYNEPVKCLNPSLTYIKDESIAESVVSVVTPVDKKFSVWEDSTAMPAAKDEHHNGYIQFRPCNSL